ncbi:MAG TPA: nucleotidyltransferase family protein [Sphingomicrobium sp.]
MFDSGAEPELRRDIDWRRFVRTVRFHRVQGLVWNSLWSIGGDVPGEVAESLSADAVAIAAANLRMAAEARELRSEFDRAGLALLFVKGLTLGALAYPNPMLKMSWDIDLLIAPQELADAAELLRRRGYRREIPGASVDLHSWHARHKESVWSQASGIDIELHTSLADNADLIPGIDFRSPRSQVEVAPGIVLPTLAREELFAHLCVHGASSAWFRLKWISDFAGLVARCSVEEIERLYRRSQELGAARAAGQALAIANELFDTPLPNVTMDRATRELAAAALRQLETCAEPTGQPLGTWRIHWTQLLLKPGLGFKAGEIVRQARSALQ